MAILKCEICGGRLMAKSGGIFECDSCGMQYDKSRIQEMVQEIKGTVKVEGTVEVKGVVKVEGGVNLENLLKRGQLALENKKWGEAGKSFDAALNIDAECVDAYLGNCCVYYGCSNIKEAIHKYGAKIYDNADLKNALRFMTPDAVSQIEKEVEAVEENLKKIQRQKEEALAAAEEEKRRQEQAALEKRRADWITARERVTRVKGLFSSGSKHMIGLNLDGSVMAKGENNYGQCNAANWKDIISVAAGNYHTVGLKSDGTVVAVGRNDVEQCEVRSWKGITAISVYAEHTVGLKADGTVITTGDHPIGKIKSNGNLVFTGISRERQQGMVSWQDMIAVSAGNTHTVGLHSDGTVVAVGYNDCGQCDVLGWSDIITISAGFHHTVGLKADGTVCATGHNSYGECNVEDWSDIVDIAAGVTYTVGLKSNGTLVMTGRGFLPDNWKDIISIAVDMDDGLYGIKEDGTIEVKERGLHTISFDDWKLFDDVDHIEEDRIRKREERKMAQKMALESEKEKLTEELSKLKGLFSGIRRREIEARIEQINHELSSIESHIH